MDSLGRRKKLKLFACFDLKLLNYQRKITTSKVELREGCLEYSKGTSGRLHCTFGKVARCRSS